MINTLAKLLLSFMITGWIYAECVLIYPPLESIGSRFVRVFSIPTHDKWPAIASSPEAKKLGGDLESLLGKTVGKQRSIFGPRVKQLWNDKTQVAQSTIPSPSTSAPSAELKGEQQATVSGWSRFSGSRPSSFRSSGLHSFSGEMSRF